MMFLFVRDSCGSLYSVYLRRTCNYHLDQKRLKRHQRKCFLWALEVAGNTTLLQNSRFSGLNEKGTGYYKAGATTHNFPLPIKLVTEVEQFKTLTDVISQHFRRNIWVTKVSTFLDLRKGYVKIGRP